MPDDWTAVGTLDNEPLDEDRFEDHLRPCFNVQHSGYDRTMISCDECRAEVGLGPRAS